MNCIPFTAILLLLFNSYTSLAVQTFRDCGPPTTTAALNFPQIPSAHSAFPPYVPDTNTTSKLARLLVRSWLGRRQDYCDIGYYSCTVGDPGCCPDGTCCGYLDDCNDDLGGGCCSGLSCYLDETCCADLGCIPSGTTCCSDGTWCPAGNECIGALDCCTDSSCTAYVDDFGETITLMSLGGAVTSDFLQGPPTSVPVVVVTDINTSINTVSVVTTVSSTSVLVVPSTDVVTVVHSQAASNQAPTTTSKPTSVAVGTETKPATTSSKGTSNGNSNGSNSNGLSNGGKILMLSLVAGSVLVFLL